MLLLLLSSARAVQAMSCVNHSLQSHFFPKEFFDELIVNYKYANNQAKTFGQQRADI